MAARQATRRRTRESQRRPAALQISVRGARRVAGLVFAAGVMGAIALAAGLALDRPLTALTVDGPFQRVTLMQVREAIGPMPEGRTGFLSVDLPAMRQRLESLDWVDTASVRRVWPDKLHVVIVEQTPAARWGDHGLLNVRGELFVSHARHELAELPRLSGPDSAVREVAAQYLALRGRLVESGLGLRAVNLDERGAWRLVLDNGIEVRLGRDDADKRAKRFIDSAADLVARHADKIRYVDMCYSNGFAVRWNTTEHLEEVRLEAAALAAAAGGNL